MIDVHLSRIVLRGGTDHQYIYLKEREGERVFPILIGSGEANEIHRIAHGQETPRPLTHQLAHNLVEALGAQLERVDIVALRENTFFAQLTLRGTDGSSHAVVDARPSDAIALALRARAPIRVDDSIFEAAADLEQ